MATSRRRILTTIMLVLFGITAFVTWWLFYPRKIYPASIYVETGDPFYTVVRQLKDREIIGSPWLFSKAGILIGLDRHITPGRYDFSTRSSNFTVFRKLWRGEIAIMTVTIPEGYTLAQISRLLHQRCSTGPDIFDSLVRDSTYLAGLGIDAGFAEGYLFPETYRFEWGITAGQAIEAMVAELFTRITPAIRARSDTMGYSLHELLTMASIIEKEGMVYDEYPVIASVYYNRYCIGMKLQADPTVIYGMGGLDRDLMVRDYQFPSIYNSYLHHGLPPTPICSPGMEAIRAALYPDSTEYLYFVADGKGRHIFNTSYQQHLQDTKRIKRELRGK